MALYRFGGTPSDYILDRGTHEFLINYEFDVLTLDKATVTTGLYDEDLVPTASLQTDGDGFFAFHATDLPAVYLRVTDSKGVKDWGPVLAPQAAVDAVTLFGSAVSALARVTAVEDNIADLQGTITELSEMTVTTVTGARLEQGPSLPQPGQFSTPTVWVLTP